MPTGLPAFRIRALPTLLGLLLAVAGLLALTNFRVPAPDRPPRVTLEPLPTPAFQALLLQDTGGEIRSREVVLRAADTPAARLGSSLRALKTWLGEAWPAELGAPKVFWLGRGRAVLDFPLRGAPESAVASELQLLGSIRETAARQGVTDVFIIVNGAASTTFLGQVALSQVLE